MNDHDPSLADLRANLVDGLLAARTAEREVLAAVDPATRDTPAADGGWSAKDVQAHLSAWKRRQVNRLEAIREGRDEPGLASDETDELNATFHAERADWTWDRVDADADATTDELVAETVAASVATLTEDRVAGAIMGNGPEHALTHLSPIAAQFDVGTVVLDLASTLETIIDRDGWPSRAGAFARYNLACFHALGGRLDAARTLLRQALPAEEELRTFAPLDDDLIALRDEMPALTTG